MVYGLTISKQNSTFIFMYLNVHSLYSVYFKVHFKVLEFYEGWNE